MRLPVLPEQLQGAVGEWDIAVLGTFAAVNVNHHAFRVEIADFEIESFFQSEAQRIDGPEIDSVASVPNGGHDLVDFVDGQDIGQRFLLGDTQLFEYGQSRGTVKV